MRIHPGFSSVIVLIILIAFSRIPSYSQEKNDLSPTISSNLSKTSQQKFEICSNQRFGFEYLCDASWPSQTDGESELIILSKNPLVVFVIQTVDPYVVYLEQISQEFLNKKKYYAEGFSMEESEFAGQQAIKVKGYSRFYPGIRRLDYFFIYNSTLYGVLISVSPKEKWDEQKHIIQKIVESFHIIGKNPS